jgi:hypothetical protein
MGYTNNRSYMLKILCTKSEFHCLFPTAIPHNIQCIESVFNKISLELNGEYIEVHHYMENIFNIVNENINSNPGKLLDLNNLYMNPIDNLVIVVDRKLWSELYLPLLKNHYDIFLKLEDVYLKKNIKVLFNFAFFEALEYEMFSEYYLYDFKFNHIKLTDYELFKNEKNFYYDSFFTMFHIFAEGMMNPILFPNVWHSHTKYLTDFSVFIKNLNITNNFDSKKLYMHLVGKPRYHRMLFLLKAFENNIIESGINSVNEKYLKEYMCGIYENSIFTDNTNKHNKNHILHFTKENIDKVNSFSNLLTIKEDNHLFEHNHSFYYFNDKEYNNSFIEIVGETHGVFDLKYGIFTEKSIKPILAERFVLIYGSNKIYKEYEKLGINLFLEEFGLIGIENKDSIEQIDMIITFLKKIDIEWIRNFYINNFDKILDNKKKLINHYFEIMNNINKLL